MKQKKFADAYLDTGNGSQSAHAVYDVTSDESARAIASQNLTKPTIIQYLESKAEIASKRLVELSLQDEHLPTALGASKDILDRSGYGAIDRSINLKVNAEDLAKVIQADITRFRTQNTQSSNVNDA